MVFGSKSSSKERTALDSAFGSLSRRPLTEAELSKKLLDKGYSPEEVAGAVQRCKEYGYINDAELVVRVAKALARERRLGEWAVQRKLEQRGFSKSLVEHGMQSLFNSADIPSAFERAKSLAAKKFRGAEGDVQNREKLIRFLRARGFDWDTIRSVFEVD